MLIVLLAGLLAGNGSPPPPPQNPPAEAQRAHDGYDGPALWRVWTAWVRVSAIAERDAAFAAATARDGWRHDSDGPVTTTTTGYWTEGFEAGFVQLCELSSEACEWAYRSARLTARAEDFHALAAQSFDGQAIAASLRARGVMPADLSEASAIDFSDLVDLQTLLEPTRLVQVAWESDCPAVGSWQMRLATQDPLALAPVAGTPPTRPLPPYPIHIRQIVELPVEAYGGAEVTVRIDGVRNRAVSDLWQLITDGIRDCH